MYEKMTKFAFSYFLTDKMIANVVVFTLLAWRAGYNLAMRRCSKQIGNG